MITIIAAIVVTLIALKYWWDNSEFGRCQRIIKRDFEGPPGNPIFGNTFQVSGGPAMLTRTVIFDWYPKFKSPMKVTLGPISFFHLFKAEHVEKIFKDNKNIKKGSDYDRIKDWLGNGLLLSTGQKWFQRRKLLTPAFHFGILKNFMPIFNQQSKILVDLLRKDAAESKGQAFDICSRISICSLDIICESAMGRKINAQRDSNNPYVQSIKDFSALTNYRGIRPWLWSDFVMHNFTLNMGKMWTATVNRLHTFTGDIIDSRSNEWKSEQRASEKTETTENIEDVPKRRMAFLDLLLGQQDNGKIDIGGIKEEVDTFTFEGHDTTATGLMWAVYSLARHPDIQQRCREEIASVIGDRADFEADDLPKMTYLDQCLKESQRMWPSVPIIEREIETPVELDEKHIIPRGTTVAVTIFGLHRDADQFPEPGKYDPDRFLPENTVNRHPFAFVPFAAGLRNCIGQKYATMETKVIMCHLLQNFKFECSQKEEDMAPAMLFILRPTEGVWVKLTPL